MGKDEKVGVKLNIWTNDQLSAIENRGGTLLVSAAAGSGKTAVLVERILSKITNEGVNIDEFLVVTFTNAAAKEMKDKIIKVIAKKSDKEPTNGFLRNQISLVHKAQITTVHSFCFNLLRENFTQLKISPDFKVLADLDTEILKKECMNSVISVFFIEMTEEFKILVDILGEKNIESELLSVYNFIQSNSNPKKYLDDVYNEYKKVVKNGFIDSIWCQIIWEKLEKVANQSIKLSNEMIEYCEMDSVLKEKNLGKITHENTQFIQLLDVILAKDWDEIYKICNNIKFDRWSTCAKSLTPEIVEKAIKNRNTYKDNISEILQLVYLPIDEINLQANKLHSAIYAMINVINKFEIAYSAEKLARNSLDFNDAEHKMIELLVNQETGEKSEIAHEISNRFHEIMVDEYQDTNEIQDTLFKLLSKDEKNIFMVGDIKQSIYKFRLADPMIFAKKNAEYSLIDTVKDNEPRKVSLSKNFRSRQEILSATNFIFENIMTENAGGVDYTDDQKLYLGANYEKNNHVIPEFCLIDYKNFGKDKTKTEIEAEAIAREINKIVDEKMQVTDAETGVLRNVRYSDIVILLRSTSNKAGIYKKMLENFGINIDFKLGSEELFGSPEVSTLISLLKVLDNHLLEVELISIMRSKIFDFSDEEIAKIRILDKEKSFFECLNLGDDEKIMDFLEKVEEIRKYSQNNTIFSTLWYVIHEFDILAKYSIMTNGEYRRSNILRFLDFVNSIDDGFSIYDFVKFLDKIDHKKVVIPSGLKSGDSVKIVTMHKSKGLEYPVVFLADIAKKFNEMDMKKPLIMHNKLGIALKYIDDDNIVTYPSLMQKVIKMKITHENVSEEMRILYVAMTRAKEKMYVFCTVNDAQKTFEKWLLDSEPIECNSFQSWFGMNIVKLPSAKIYYEQFEITDNVKINHDLEDFFKCRYIDKFEDISVKIQDESVKKDFEIVNFKYPYENCAKIPSKITATAINAMEMDKKHETIKKPSFLTEKKLSATEIGIANHIVMQFIKFENCANISDIKQEVLRLYEQKFITQKQYECVSPQKIHSFINSEIGDRLQKSQEVVREFKFSLLANASEFYDTTGQEKVLLQGVIDCFFIENDKIILIDYKTDFVNASNIDEVSQTHKIQFDIYQRAIEEIFDKKVSEKYLYYFKTEGFYQV